MLKYFILWSFSSSLALLDGIVTPAPPACISHIYLYSDMWKYARLFVGWVVCRVMWGGGGGSDGRVVCEVDNWVFGLFFCLRWSCGLCEVEL